MKNPDILDLTSGFATPGMYHGFELPFEIVDSGNPEKVSLSLLWVDSEFLEFYGIKFLNGRNFNKDLISDRTGPMILNEAAIKECVVFGEEIAGSNIRTS